MILKNVNYIFLTIYYKLKLQIKKLINANLTALIKKFKIFLLIVLFMYI